MKIPLPILITVYCLLFTSLFAQTIPSLINYQGRVLDTAGNPLSDNVAIVVDVFTNQTVGSSVYFEDLGTVAVNNGIFSIQFGSDASGMASALAHSEAWLEVKVDGVALAPRQRLIAVPYAHAAGRVEGPIVAVDNPSATPAAGSIRWTGSAFEGFNGTTWVPLSAPQPLVIPEVVEVGNPNNVDDTALNGSAPGDHSGSVAYTYKIGKYEVTNAEYVQFLNAVDPNGVNATALYNPSMDSDNSNGGIRFTAGNGDGLKYTVKNGFASKPVVYVSFYDAMRFCNWLHNGAQAGGDTENGAYTLVPPVDPAIGAPTNGVSVERNAGAKFALPTEDEWYKAAYHQPQANGGPADHYWLYPTPTGRLNGNDTDPPNNGDPSVAAAPAANYLGSGLTDVGAYATTRGYYGTFDMAGNVYEWIETRSGSSRVLRGGSWVNFEIDLRSGVPFPDTPGFEDSFIGFRLSSP